MAEERQTPGGKKKKERMKEPTHVWAYMARMGVPKSVIKQVKIELVSWAMAEADQIKAARIYTVLASLLWDRGWRQKRVTQFIRDFGAEVQRSVDMGCDAVGRPWSQYTQEIAEKTHMVFQDVDDNTVQMMEVDFSDEEWDLKKEDEDGDGKG